MSGFAIGSPVFMAAFLGAGLLQKWKAERPQWRHGQGQVGLTSDRIRVITDNVTSDVPYGLLGTIKYEGQAVVFEDVFHTTRFRVFASDPAFFSRIIEYAARPKMWQSLPLETPAYLRPIVTWLQGGGIAIGLPAGWLIDPMPGRHTPGMGPGEAAVAAASGPPTERWTPWFVLSQMPGPVSRQDVEAMAFAFQSLAKMVNPSAEFWCAPRRLNVGGEVAVTAGLRAIDPSSGACTRELRVKAARGGIPFHAYMNAEDSDFDARWPEFETMLATWRWWDTPADAAPWKALEANAAQLQLPE